MRKDRRFHTYILASSSGTLYIGVTNNIGKRVWQHKQGEIAGFTKQYTVDRLVYFESFDDIRTAINREKQLKGWVRAKKIWLIERENPSWLDLSRAWFESSGPSTPPLRGSAQDDKGKTCLH
jgi:putative endonuclease